MKIGTNIKVRFVLSLMFLAVTIVVSSAFSEGSLSTITALDNGPQVCVWKGSDSALFRNQADEVTLVTTRYEAFCTVGDIKPFKTYMVEEGKLGLHPWWAAGKTFRLVEKP